MDRGLARARGLAGALGLVVVGLLSVALHRPALAAFPEGLLRPLVHVPVRFLVASPTVPSRHEPDWVGRARPGDVLFMSRGSTAWGEWSHVAVVVRVPEDRAVSSGLAAGSLALVDGSVFDGMYLAPLSRYTSWPAVVLRRADDDPETGDRIAEAALRGLDRVFVFSTRLGHASTNCAATAIEALRAAGLDPGVDGWQAPDLLFRSPLWGSELERP